MTRSQKIDFIIDRRQARGLQESRAYLESKSDAFIDKVFTVEEDIEEQELDETIATFF